MTINVEFSRPRDEVDGPKFGPFEWVQLTYEGLRVSPDGEHIAYYADGEWVIAVEWAESEETYSDIVIA